MIHRLSLQDFTVFKDVSLEFSRGLNVIVGENGTGKTHLLKLSYMFCNAWSKLQNGHISLGKQRAEAYFADRMNGLFKPDRIGNLSRMEGKGKTTIQAQTEAYIPTVRIHMPNEADPGSMPEPMDWSLQFSNRNEKNITLGKLPETFPANAYLKESVYLPTKEIVSFFDGFIGIAEKYNLQFDETYVDLAKNLNLPKLKKQPVLLKKQLSILSKTIGGALKLEGGRFYLNTKEKKSCEITLVAEGLRKIATLLHLIENNSLASGGTIFWDEPEANLNPRLVKVVASVLCRLVQEGIQVVLATHNLFLMRELFILLQDKSFQGIDARFFGLHFENNVIAIQQGSTLDDIGDIASLDEDLMQSDRYMEAE